MGETSSGNYYSDIARINQLLDGYSVYEDGGNYTVYDEGNDEEYQIAGGNGFDVPSGRGYQVDGTQVVGGQETGNVTSLTDNSGGTTDDTVEAISGSGADSAINNNFAELAAQVNGIITTLQNHGLHS